MALWTFPAHECRVAPTHQQQVCGVWLLLVKLPTLDPSHLLYHPVLVVRHSQPVLPTLQARAYRGPVSDPPPEHVHLTASAQCPSSAPLHPLEVCKTSNLHKPRKASSWVGGWALKASWLLLAMALAFACAGRHCSTSDTQLTARHYKSILLTKKAGGKPRYCSQLQEDRVESHGASGGCTPAQDASWATPMWLQLLATPSAQQPHCLKLAPPPPHPQQCFAFQ